MLGRSAVLKVIAKLLRISSFRGRSSVYVGRQNLQPRPSRVLLQSAEYRQPGVRRVAYKVGFPLF